MSMVPSTLRFPYEVWEYVFDFLDLDMLYDTVHFVSKHFKPLSLQHRRHASFGMKRVQYVVDGKGKNVIAIKAYFATMMRRINEMCDYQMKLFSEQQLLEWRCKFGGKKLAPCITTLDLTNSPIHASKLIILLQHVPFLSYLCLRNCPYISNRFCFLFSSNLPPSNEGNTTEEGNNEIPSADQSLVPSASESELTTTILSTTLPSSSLADFQSGVKVFQSIRNHLQILDIGGCRKLDHKGLSILFDFLSPSQTLKRLIIKGCFLVKDETLQYISSKMPMMEHLDVQGMSITENALKGFRNLKSLNLRHTSSINGKEIMKLCMESAWKSLNTLILKNVHQKVLPNDNVMISILNSCPMLKVLEIQGLVHLTDKSFRKMKDMEHLNLIGCSITDDGIKELVKNNYESLFRIELKECMHLTNHGIIMAFCSNETPCNHLRILNLMATNVNEDIIPHLLKTLPRLQLLNLSECQNLNDPSNAKVYFFPN